MRLQLKNHRIWAIKVQCKSLDLSLHWHIFCFGVRLYACLSHINKIKFFLFFFIRCSLLLLVYNSVDCFSFFVNFRSMRECFFFYQTHTHIIRVLHVCLWEAAGRGTLLYCIKLVFLYLQSAFPSFSMHRIKEVLEFHVCTFAFCVYCVRACCAYTMNIQ